MAEKETCKYPAQFRYTWPGNDEALCCSQHAVAIKAVAKAIGLHQQMIPLSGRDRVLGLLCQSADDLPKEGE